MKQQSVRCATALASSVLPVPRGGCASTPIARGDVVGAGPETGASKVIAGSAGRAPGARGRLQPLSGRPPSRGQPRQVQRGSPSRGSDAAFRFCPKAAQSPGRPPAGQQSAGARAPPRLVGGVDTGGQLFRQVGTCQTARRWRPNRRSGPRSRPQGPGPLQRRRRPGVRRRNSRAPRPSGKSRRKCRPQSADSCHSSWWPGFSTPGPASAHRTAHWRLGQISGRTVEDAARRSTHAQ